MGRIKMPKIDPGVTVDIGPESDLTEFKLVITSQRVEEELDSATEEIQAVTTKPDATPRERFEVVAKQLDILLEALPRPAGDQLSEKEKRTPSEIMLAAYDATERKKQVTRGQLNALIDELVVASRPS